MKTIKYIIVGLISLIMSFGTTSCSDFLDSKVYDFTSPDNFYKNKEEAQMGLAGVYYSLARHDSYGNVYSCMISNLDDLSFYVRGASSTASDVYGHGHNTSNTDVYNAWATFYKGIESANMFIESIEKNDVDADVKTRVLGEAKFLRAYYHFLLVQTWKDVPIRKNAFKDVNKSALAATPQAEAYDWIIEEMEATLTMVDDSEYDLSPSHVKKNVVLGILARVSLARAGYPTNGGKPYYEKALKYAKQVKDSQKHRMNPDVYAIWKNMASDRYDKEYNESMWEVEFIGTRDNGDYTDGRIGNTIGNKQQNGSQDGLGYSYWFYGGSLILWDLYETNDARRDLTLAPYWYNNKDVIQFHKPTQVMERSCGKFRREWETTVPRNKNWTQENWPILRYADVLLMLAEAENEVNQSPTPLAYEAVNAIRERAGVDIIPAGLSYKDFQQRIRDERGRELVFEATRKYDLIRWGIYLEAIADLGEATNDPRWSKGDVYSTAKAFAQRTQKKHEFMPIPAKEMFINTELEQNPLW